MAALEVFLKLGMETPGPTWTGDALRREAVLRERFSQWLLSPWRAAVMSYQIIQQPDGAYALWSTGTDRFAMLDARPDDLVGYLLAYAERRIRENVTDVIEQLAA